LAGLEWHTLEIDELCRRLSADTTQGLSDDQIKRRLAEHGRNKMTPPPSGLFKKITGYFFGGFGSILIVAGVLVFVAWKPLGNPPAVANLALACVLLAVWLIQAAFNAWQDWSTSRVMSSIGTMLPDACIGSHVSISALDLVPGDIIVIKQGNKLPADVRLVEVSSDAMFDRSILTGKNTSIHRSSISLINKAAQVNQNPSPPQSSAPKRTTSRRTTLACKARTVLVAVAWVFVLRLAITLSLVELRSLPLIPRLA
jgi:sodium/potassium-transporting ATPase subunit alpha